MSPFAYSTLDQPEFFLKFFYSLNLFPYSCHYSVSQCPVRNKDIKTCDDGFKTLSHKLIIKLVSFIYTSMLFYLGNERPSTKKNYHFFFLLKRK